MVAVTAVADLAAQALKEVAPQYQSHNPPPPLPIGWVTKESRSTPNAYYYYNQVTGETSWYPPTSLIPEEDQDQQEDQPVGAEDAATKSHKHGKTNDSSRTDSEDPASRKRSHEDTVAPVEQNGADKKKRKASAAPSQVRVLHILKKHKDSRRPSSWRSNNQPITITREEAVGEIEGLLEILKEEESNPDNLVATFKELASQESDCSSAKRHGDLGFFGRKKMRPEFEKAAFALDVNQLSGIVETASGAHVLLRLE